MRISVLIGLTLGALLAIIFAIAGLTLFHSRQSASWDQRIALAQESYSEHLMLQANVIGLFKQHGDALLFGDRDGGALENELKLAIEGNLAAIRSVIAREIELVGEDEIEELDLLAEIESKVGWLTRTLTTLAEDGTVIDADTRKGQLISLMDREIDQLLGALIIEALAGERLEVSDTLAKADAFHDLIQNSVFVLIAASLSLACLAAVIYQRGVTRPIQNITNAVLRYQRGDFIQPPDVRGTSELRSISLVLRRMAEQLSERQTTQDEQTRALEDAITTRTSELSHVLGQVERAEAARRQMMADVSHELRTPLTIIQGEADVSMRGPIQSVEVYRESLSRIRETSKHANAIVDDLLLIARQEAGKLRLDLTEVDLCQLARRTAELAGRNIHLDLAVPRAKVRADPVRVRQSLLALLQNAVRYGGSTITLRVEAAAEGFRLVVEDDGPGMSEPEKAGAFDRFFRGTDASSRKTDGTGLGLPIVRSIALAHGGTAGIDDRPGGGLRVWIELPEERPLKLVTDGSGQEKRA